VPKRAQDILKSAWESSRKALDSLGEPQEAQGALGGKEHLGSGSIPKRA
jgi:hypothetical protein